MGNKFKMKFLPFMGAFRDTLLDKKDMTDYGSKFSAFFVRDAKVD